MLTFDDRFHSDGLSSCVLWADEPTMKRVCFNIGARVLQDVLQGGNPVHDDANVALCERMRKQIELACRRAFMSRPTARVDLRSTDFS